MLIHIQQILACLSCFGHSSVYLKCKLAEWDHPNDFQLLSFKFLESQFEQKIEGRYGEEMTVRFLLNKVNRDFFLSITDRTNTKKITTTNFELKHSVQSFKIKDPVAAIKLAANNNKEYVLDCGSNVSKLSYSVNYKVTCKTQKNQEPPVKHIHLLQLGKPFLTTLPGPISFSVRMKKQSFHFKPSYEITGEIKHGKDIVKDNYYLGEIKWNNLVSKFGEYVKHFDLEYTLGEDEYYWSCIQYEDGDDLPDLNLDILCEYDDQVFPISLRNSEVYDVRTKEGYSALKFYISRSDARHYLVITNSLNNYGSYRLLLVSGKLELERAITHQFTYLGKRQINCWSNLDKS
eukprot:NODE_47_length_27404_cov_0.284270.p8 type:complete len:347 gc:universal NODE_47_length_27404_cov_0.284270:3579-4619(+)